MSQKPKHRYDFIDSNILEYLNDHGGATQSEIATEFSLLSKNAIVNRLNTLCADEILLCEKSRYYNRYYPIGTILQHPIYQRREAL